MAKTFWMSTERGWQYSFYNNIDIQEYIKQGMRRSSPESSERVNVINLQYFVITYNWPILNFNNLILSYFVGKCSCICPPNMEEYIAEQWKRRDASFSHFSSKDTLFCLVTITVNLFKFGSIGFHNIWKKQVIEV